MKNVVLILTASFLCSLSQADQSGSCSSYIPVKKAELTKIGADMAGDAGCTGSACPNLQCRDMQSITYANVQNGSFRGARFSALGYSEDMTSIQNSDLRNVSIQSVNSINLSGCNLQNANIEYVGGYANLSAVDLRGARIGQIDNVETITWKGAIYDSTSRLPFSDVVAASMGLVKK